MSQPDVVRYRRGVAVDTTKALEVVGFSASDWGVLDAVYPELAGARGASFRSGRNRTVTIYPPMNGPVQLLEAARAMGNERTHTVYEGHERSRLVWVLVHVHGEYEAVHIYRLRK
jgi:hypothetical protein